MFTGSMNLMTATETESPSPRGPVGAGRRVWLVVNGLMVGAVMVAAVASWSPGQLNFVALGIAMILAGISVIVAFTDRSLRDTSSVRRSAIVMVVAGALVLVGFGAMTIIAEGPTTTWQALLDVRSIGAAVLIVVAVLRFPQPMHGTREDRILVWIDFTSAAVACIVITGVVVVPASAGAGQVGALAGIRPWADAVIAAFVVLLACRSRMPGALPFRQILLLVLAGGIFVLTNALAIVLGSGHVGMDAELLALAVELVAVWLVVIAALRPSAERELPSEIRSREWLTLTVPLAPVVAALVALVWLVAKSGVDSGPLVLIGSVSVGLSFAALLVLRHVLARGGASRSSVALADSAAPWLHTVVDAAPDMVTVADLRCRVVYQTPSVSRVLGFEPGHWRERLIYDFVHPDDHAALAEVTARAAREIGRPRSVRLRLRCRDGSWRESDTAVTALPGEDGLPGYVLRTKDVAELQRRMSTEPQTKSLDELTGLANRSALLTHADQSILGAAPGNVAVLALDLDGFRAINDTIGHDTGDEILRQVGAALQRCVRPWDLVARMGGDEFAVLIVGANAERSVGRVHERLQRALSAVLIPDGREVRIAISAGYSVNDSGTESSEQLVRNADLALARVRSASRVEVLRFEASMHDGLVERMHAEHELRSAVAEGRLELAYQPIVRLSDGMPIGAEALIRWRHATRGLVLAGDFVPLAEEMGIIHELGVWALRQASRDLAQLRRDVDGLAQFSMSVNVSGYQLEPALLDEVRSASEAGGISPADLVLEVTESVLADHPEHAADVLREARALGCRVAFDDFGTGYSSLSYLAQFPVDVLKIDKSFVQDVVTSTQSLALTRTIASLGQALGLPVVAEGVETAEQATVLRDLGCENAQGYVFSRPVPLASLQQILLLGTPLGPPAPAGSISEQSSGEFVVLADHSELPAARPQERSVNDRFPSG
ncbi:MAG: putative bifunctional diguanylate cyclase/phosphodiesterase [Candidatus Nanopelagicales bacterium]